MSALSVATDEIQFISLIFLTEEGAGFSSWIDKNYPSLFENALKEAQDALESKEKEIFIPAAQGFKELILERFNEFCDQTHRDPEKAANEARSLLTGHQPFEFKKLPIELRNENPDDLKRKTKRKLAKLLESCTS